MKPVIGIVVCGFADDRQFVSQPYIQAVSSAGGLPSIIPILTGTLAPSRSTDYKNYLSLCDGLLFCGGDDITPLLFGEEPIFSPSLTDIQTDLFQISLMKYALSSSKPILAVCRGMQVLNVALGGTVYQDISLKKGLSLSHMQHSQNRSDISHRVSFQKNSMLYKIFGDHAYTNSFHHQAIHVPGTRLSITGTTSDSVIESIESTRHPFVIGVQWHPECMYDFSYKMRRLFQEFISRSGKNQKTE